MKSVNGGGLNTSVNQNPDFHSEMIKDMQREKERLHRFLKNREKSKLQNEEYEKRVNDIVIKKELKLKKI
jgi:hypothetical protein